MNRTKSLDIRGNKPMKPFECPDISSDTLSSTNINRSKSFTCKQEVESNQKPKEKLSKTESCHLPESVSNYGTMKPPRKQSKKKRLSRKSSKSRSFCASSPYDCNSPQRLQFAPSYSNSNNYKNLFDISGHHQHLIMESSNDGIMSPTTGYDCRKDPHLWPGWWKGRLSERLAATVPTQPVSPCDSPTPQRKTRKVSQSHEESSISASSFARIILPPCIHFQLSLCSFVPLFVKQNCFQYKIPNR